MTDSITRVDVRMGPRSYQVRIGAGARHDLPEFVERLRGGRAVVVSARPHDEVADPGVPWRFLNAHDGEANKTLAMVEAMCRELADFGPHLPTSLLARWTRASAARRRSTCRRARTWSARNGSRGRCSATLTICVRYRARNG